MAQKIRKPRPIKWEGTTWNREVREIEQEWCPKIVQCVDCTHPTPEGYCCRNCGSCNPEGV